MAETVKIPGELESFATGNKVADVAYIKDKTKGNKSQFQINAEHEAALSDRYTKEETYNKEEVEQMVTPPSPDYKYYATYAEMIAETSHPAGAIYRVSSYDGTQVDATSYAEYTWNGSEYKLLDVKSQVNEVFDITVYNSNTKYADLTAALGVDGANVPEGIQRGGMSVKFVQSSDNKYIQARCMAQNFTTDVTQWQTVDEEPTAGSDNLVKSAGILNLFNSQYGLSLTDLEFSDEEGNAIAAFEKGHIRTKEFDSSQNATLLKRGLMSAEDKNKLENNKTKLDTIEEGAEVNNVENVNNPGDFDIDDGKGYSIASFSNGHIKTKNFDSSKVGIESSNAEITEKTDFDISDENGNKVVEFGEGHIKTKEFNSRKALVSQDTDSLYKDEDFSFCDEQNNRIAIFKNGHIKTKNFDSEKIKESIDEVIKMEETTLIPLNIIKTSPGFTSVVRHWGFVGASLDSGTMYYKEDGEFHSITDYDYSWGQIMCRLCGSEGYNFSVGGQTAKGWIDGNTSRTWDASGSHQGASVNLKQCYVINLGGNDAYRMDEVYSEGLGNCDDDIDLQDYHNNNENTFAGCYAGVIQRIRSVQPRAIIFICTIPTDRQDLDGVHSIIRQMPDLFDNVFLLDLDSYAPDYANQEFIRRYWYGGHFEATGYVFMAYMMCTYIDWVIRNNWSAFKDVAFIGTDHYIR